MMLRDEKGRYIGGALFLENNPAWKGGSGRAWARKVAKDNLTWICDICGSNKKLLVHHKDYHVDNNHPDNLQVLCPKCHHATHPEIRRPRRGEEVACSYCGALVYRPQHWLTRNKRHFCSQDCYVKYRRERKRK